MLDLVIAVLRISKRCQPVWMFPPLDRAGLAQWPQNVADTTLYEPDRNGTIRVAVLRQAASLVAFDPNVVWRHADIWVRERRLGVHQVVGQPHDPLGGERLRLERIATTTPV